MENCGRDANHSEESRVADGDIQRRTGLIRRGIAHGRHRSPTGNRGLTLLAIRALGALLFCALTAPPACAALASKLGQFPANTSPGNQSVTGVGFQPKAVMFWITPQTSPGTAASGRFGRGWASGGGQSGAVATAWESGASGAAHDSRVRIVNSACITLIDETGAILAEAGYTSHDVDGFTINWTTAPASPYTVVYLALGGTSLTNAQAGSWIQPAGAGVHDEPVGFNPSAVLVAGVEDATAFGTSTTGGHSFGYALSAANQASVTHEWQNGTTTPPFSGRGFYDSTFNPGGQGPAMLVFPDAAYSATPHLAIRYTTPVANQFRATSYLGAPKQAAVAYLALEGVTAAAGVLTRPGVVGDQGVATGFNPGAVLFFGHDSDALNTFTSTPQVGETVAGAATRATQQAGYWMGHQEGSPFNASTDSSRNFAVRSLDPTAAPLKATVATFSTAVAAFTNVTGGSLVFTPSTSSEVWILLVSARLESSSTANVAAEAQYLVNGVPHGLGGITTDTANLGASWQHFYRVTGTTAAQTVQVQVRAVAGTTTIEDLQLIAFKLPPNADFRFAQTEPLQTVTSDVWQSYQNLTFTPPSAGQYLVMALANGHEAPGTSGIGIRLKDPSGAFWPIDDLGSRQGHVNIERASWWSFFVARVQNLTASPQSFDLEANGADIPVGSGSEIQNVRIMAFRLDAFDAAQSVENTALTSTTSTTPVVKSTLTTAAPLVASDYLVIQGMALHSTNSGNERRAEFKAGGAVKTSYAHAFANSNHRVTFGFFDTVNTSASVLYENTFSTSSALQAVGAKESVIHVLRFPNAEARAFLKRMTATGFDLTWNRLPALSNYHLGWLALGPGSGTTEVTLVSFEARARDSAVDLSWTTASELQNLGFHLYRATSAEGPFERITSSLIPGLGSSPTGASYSYRDGGLRNGQTYYYRLEDVETTGRTEQHGPASATPTAAPGDGTPPDESGSAPARVTYGEPEATSFRVVERGPRHALIELLTPGFYAVPEGDGTVHLEIPGFESPGVPGAPSVPVMRRFVEALAGRRVRLTSVVSSDEVRFDGLRVAPADAPEVVVTAEGMIKAGRVRKRGGVRQGLFPRSWAQLLGVSFQGETKKARVELSPLRHEAATGTTLLARRLLVRLEFVGVEKAERALGGPRGRRVRPLPPLRGRLPAAELVTKEAGLYAVRYEDVFESPRPVLSAGLRLTYQGQGVGYRLEPPGATFGPGSVLYFVSEGSKSNPWGDAVYTLETGEGAVVMPVLSASPSGPVTAEYLDEKVWEENHFYQAGLLEAKDLWLWDRLVSPETKSYGVTLSAVSPSSTSAHLAVWLQGASDFEANPDHHVKVSVNGREVGEASWDGNTEKVIEAEVGPGVLQPGDNTVSLESVQDTGAYSIVFLNRFSLRYPRPLMAENEQIQGRFDQSGTAEVAGLTGPSFVLDTLEEPKWLSGLVHTDGGVSFRAEAGRKYLVLGASALKTPTIRRAPASRLRRASNGADWLLIAPKEFLATARPLVDLRASQGLRVKAVSVEEISREFGHGETRPEAVKDFLAYAYESWRRPSFRYVVLLGDGTYDPKDYLGTGVKDRIPPYMLKTSYLWTASDPSYGALNGEDLLPDVALGRLPAGTVEEARIMVDKIVAFETGGRSVGGRAVLIADNADSGGSFEADADELAATVLRDREVEKVYLRELGGGTRATIVASLDSGPGLVSYVGHGGTAVWASENVFNNTDVASLSPQGQQPLLLTLNCLNGFFHFPPLDSLAEAFVKAEGKGAVAAFSPSGLSLNDSAHVYHRSLLEQLESGRHARLGDAILAAQGAYADSGALPELLSIYHLFGDPALRLR